MRSRVALQMCTCVASLVTAVRPGGAQEFALVPARSTVVPRVTPLIVAPAVLVATTPPAFETVEIPLPAEFPRGVVANYVVTPVGGLRILGAMSGSLTPTGHSSGSKSLLLTIAVPMTVGAGIMEVARVRFNARGSVPVDVPIHIQVGAAPGIDFVVPSGQQRVVIGGRLALRYGVVNTGNRAEAVTVAAEAPADWRVVPREIRIDLQVGAIAERTVEIEVPVGGNTGSATVQLIAAVAGVPLARASVDVLVVPRASTGSMIGPVLTTSVALSTSPEGPQEAWSATLRGPVTDGITVSGRVSNSREVTRRANLALLRVGNEFMQPASLVVESSSWAIGAGHSVLQGGALTGAGIAGNGLSSSVRADRWALGAFMATPSWGGFDRREGRLTGARAAFNAGHAVVSASGTRLTERGYEDRALDAWGLGAEVPSFWRGSLSTEVAHRRFASGAGLGFGMQYVRQSPDENIRVRILRAPGGRAAFADASEQFSTSVARRFGKRLGMYADWWTSRDDANTRLSTFRSGGASTGARFGLTSALAIGLGFRQSRFDSYGSGGEMRNGESGFEVNLDYHGTRAFASMRSTAGSLTRWSGATDAVAPLIEAGDRVSVDGAIGVRAGSATLRVEGRYERTEPGAGAIPERAEVGLRVERLVLFSRGPFELRANADVRRTVLTGFGSVGASASTGLEADVPLGMSLAWVAERNPFSFAVAGGSAWVHAVRVERRTGLPSWRRGGPRGIVYRDLNGDGRRNAGETGLPGALVRHDGVTAVTGPDGAFRMDATVRRGGASLDPTSLETGWIAGASVLATGRQEFAVVPVAPIVVILRVEDSQGVGVKTDTLTPAAVIARHESGRIWVARRSGADSATFDALPPGRYTLQVDVSAVAVPLTVVGTVPPFEVGASRPETIRVTLTPRQLRIRALTPPASDIPPATP